MVHDLRAVGWSDGMPTPDTRRAAVPSRVEQIDQRERHVDRIRVEDLRGVACTLAPGVVRVGRAPRQLAQRREPALAFDAAGGFRDDGQQAADAAGFVADRAVRQREPAVLQVAVAIERQQPVVDRERLAAADALELGTDRPTRLQERSRAPRLRRALPDASCPRTGRYRSL